MRASIIIPTYNERENIGILIPEIFRALPEAEVIIIDDNSPDGTSKLANNLAKDFNIKVIERGGKMGLSSAVLEGVRYASCPLIGVLDADLSHPPEAIPLLLEALDRCDVAVGSRHVKGGKTEGWPFYRKIVSFAGFLLARGLTGVRDPMSGFFFLRKDILAKNLNPRGFKILLEILVKCRPKVTEVPYHFRDRLHGKSKLGAKVMLQYMLHVLSLYRWKLFAKKPI